jgi:hypothetical protein
MMTTTLLDPTVAAAIRALSVPRAAPADSFVLHAPLELVARIGILDRLDDDDRPAALARIEELVATYEAAGAPVAPPSVGAWAGATEAAADLEAALAAGDLDAVDAAAAWLGEHVDARRARLALGATLAPSLAAAGHAPIGLHLLTKVANGSLPTTLLRGPLREVARHPDWRLTWFDRPAATAGDASCTLEERLRAVPHLGRPGSDFIFPLMTQAEGSGAAAAAIGPSLADDVEAARRTLLRAAAWSMLHDDPTQAPYGWTHCLTMPQAVLALAPDALDPTTAVSVAGTFVVGFRAAHGVEELGPLGDADGEPEGPDLTAALRAASVHPDAHLAKYVLACAHAAEEDPAWRGTYHRAAAHLVGWWSANG